VIIGKSFKNDINESLKNIQHEFYDRSLSLILAVAKNQYIIADSILQAGHPNIPLLDKINSFDHRTLQDTHDIMAAVFRYRHQKSGQSNLFDSPEDEPIEYQKLWCDWLNDELSSLKDNASFVRNVIEAVVHSNKDEGYAAEGNLYEFLVGYYSIEEWNRNLGI